MMNIEELKNERDKAEKKLQKEINEVYTKFGNQGVNIGIDFDTKSTELVDGKLLYRCDVKINLGL